ncbi:MULTISPECIES: acyl-CoA dehydrogenase family protein [Micromonospora]|uniref:Acyl-CoA dehydrogenase n=2 Tax=Micromonospora TaxID=1873 RepID=A0A9X0HZI9_9ACTN|nr:MULTISPECIES: acyl-CoA dehydrogenase family protein [Micromonospora]AEB44514.1 acyl-CoA dehydrogenase type 2 domain protein [Micromonospora maris AB-18-032]KUJ44025.1 acyl-CoA dehydrogenase [Micromonospora maris]MBL6280317.1 acyl-CoA dehydrogenase family protein [Micromonospora fiedleri]WSK45278.1 acyl-CoA dehydrogenase family protein [Micromonospora maris]
MSEVLDAVRNIVPRLRENGLESEERRWILDENTELLDKAGVFRLAVPKRFGGLDAPLPEQVAVLTEIARGCGSTAWAAVAWVSTAWMATLYPDQTQEEIFAGGSVRISGGFTPTAKAVPTDGGYLLNGSWRFNSGCRGAHWDLLAAILEEPDGTETEVFAMVPMSDLSIADDWHVSAAAATGSSTTTARDLFVPAHRVVTGEVALTTGAPGRTPTAPGRSYSLISYVVAESAAAYIGMAKAALELFLERLPGRGLAYTSWTDQRQHPLIQHRVALAANKITAAETLSASYVDMLQRRADAGEEPTWAEKAAVRGQAGTAIQLVKEAVQDLHTIAGASALSKFAPFQRFHRDLLGLTTHGLMSPDMSLEVHGRVLVGLDPDTPFL